VHARTRTHAQDKPFCARLIGESAVHDVLERG
jgi:hypothetical protein